ncbi:MAG: Glutamate synthase, partial [Verrucomicrobiaceae bacterium]|nr:Glutamate synthase [Verrucomicrobiaceae bacterium]
MGKPTGFKEFAREPQSYRDIDVRLADYAELYTEVNEAPL